MARKRFSRDDTKRVTQRIEVARNYYAQTFEARDKAHLNLYVGQHWKEMGGAELLLSSLMDNVTMNYLGRGVDLKVAGLAAEPPVFRFKPRGVGHQPFNVRETLARVWEIYIPYVWREGEVHKQLKAQLRDRYIFGRGWAAIDWKVETDEGYAEGGRPEPRKKDQGRVLYDNPVVRRVAHDRILLDPEVSTLDWEQAGYIAWEQVWSLDRIYKWARADNRVNMQVASSLKGDAEVRPRTIAADEVDPSIKNDDFKRATIWRYHEPDRVIFIPKEKPDETLLVIDRDDFPEEFYAFEGYPFEPLWGRPWPEKYDAVGFTEQLRSWQRMVNLRRSKEAQMTRTARHLVVLPDTTDEDTRQALETDLDRVLVFVPPGTSFAPKEINTTGFPPEFLQGEQMARTDYTELSGLNALRRGLVEQGLDTATETQALVSQSGVGDRDEQADWEDLNRRVCRKVKALIEQFGDAERMAAVSPEVAKGLEPVEGLVDVQQGQRFTWVRFTPQQIVDEAEVEVLAGSMGAKEEALERAQLQATIRTIIEIANSAPLLEAMGVNPAEASKLLASKFGANETERLWQASKPLPAGMIPAGLRPAPANGQATDLPGMLKSVIQAAEPGRGAESGGGENA